MNSLPALLVAATTDAGAEGVWAEDGFVADSGAEDVTVTSSRGAVPALASGSGCRVVAGESGLKTR